MKIKEITEYGVLFDDGSILTAMHQQDCCERTYADFTQIDDLAKTYDYGEVLNFREDESGFVFYGVMNNHRCTPYVFVPCYSIQNGFYDNRITVVFNGIERTKIRCDITDYLEK